MGRIVLIIIATFLFPVSAFSKSVDKKTTNQQAFNEKDCEEAWLKSHNKNRVPLSEFDCNQYSQSINISTSYPYGQIEIIDDLDELDEFENCLRNQAANGGDCPFDISKKLSTTEVSAVRKKLGELHDRYEKQRSIITDKFVKFNSKYPHEGQVYREETAALKEN